MVFFFIINCLLIQIMACNLLNNRNFIYFNLKKYIIWVLLGVTHWIYSVLDSTTKNAITLKYFSILNWEKNCVSYVILGTNYINIKLSEN